MKKFVDRKSASDTNSRIIISISITINISGKIIIIMIL